jgi:hypothetical protein
MAPLASCMDDLSVVLKTRERSYPTENGLGSRGGLPGDLPKGKEE